MIEWIDAFVASKELSENSRAAYFYDLQQFATTVCDTITREKLVLYEQSLTKLKVSVKKRKLSAINQFLFFLYETGRIDTFFKLKNSEKLVAQVVKENLIDRSLFYQETKYISGQLIALLILELGLVPNELKEIKLIDLDLDFAILRLGKSGSVRVLEIPHQLLPYLERAVSSDQIYLFDKNGKSYSRQWFFQRLKDFLAEIGLTTLTAKDLRQQFILKQKEDGKSISQVSRLLGLKSPITLEKYYKNGY